MPLVVACDVRSEAAKLSPVTSEAKKPEDLLPLVITVDQSEQRQSVTNLAYDVRSVARDAAKRRLAVGEDREKRASLACDVRSDKEDLRLWQPIKLLLVTSYVCDVISTTIIKPGGGSRASHFAPGFSIATSNDQSVSCSVKTRREGKSGRTWTPELPARPSRRFRCGCVNGEDVLHHPTSS